MKRYQSGESLVSSEAFKSIDKTPAVHHESHPILHLKDMCL